MNAFLATNKNFLENLVGVEVIFYNGNLANTIRNLREKIHLGSNWENNPHI